MIPVRLQAPMKVQIPQLEFFALYDRALRRGGLEIRRWRQHAAARNLWARLLQTSCVPVTPSPLDPRDRHTGHSLQHLVSLLHLQDHRSLFPRLHRPNFPRHFRRGKRKYHCVARATTLKTVVPFKKKNEISIIPSDFSFPFLSVQRNTLFTVTETTTTTTLVVDLDNSFVDRNCGKEYEVRAARERIDSLSRVHGPRALTHRPSRLAALLFLVSLFLYTAIPRRTNNTYIVGGRSSVCARVRAINGCTCVERRQGARDGRLRSSSFRLGCSRFSFSLPCSRLL